MEAGESRARCIAMEAGEARVVSIVFPAAAGPFRVARRWCLAHGYRVDLADRSASFYRFRQCQPPPRGRYRTLVVDSARGVMAVIVSSPRPIPWCCSNAPA